MKREVSNIEEMEIGGIKYLAVGNVKYKNQDYLVLINEKNEEDVICGRVVIGDEVKLFKLDSEEELKEVMKEFFEKYKSELEN